MRDPSDVPVHRLVVDSGAFIKHAKLEDLASEVYTTSGVIGELKCDKSRHLIEARPYEIIMQEPTTKSLHIMNEFAKKTGDYPSLSAVDMKVLALVHDLHKDAYGAEHLDYECKRKTVQFTEQSNSANECVDANATMPSDVEMNNEECVINCDNIMANNEDNSTNDDENENDDDSDGGVWINEENLQAELKNVGEICVPEKDMKVACITTDFAMQNVLLRLGMNLLSIDGYRIKRLNSYILRCRACFATTALMTKRFCSRCGNDTMHRVAVTVNEDGTTQLHINWQRLESTRGLKYSLPTPKGGKHGVGPQLFEDQRIPHNRLAKCHIDPLETGPFSMNDISSRSAVLGIKTLQRQMQGRNVNARTRGKKRGNKRR